MHLCMVRGQGHVTIHAPFDRLWLAGEQVPIPHAFCRFAVLLVRLALTAPTGVAGRKEIHFFSGRASAWMPTSCE